MTGEPGVTGAPGEPGVVGVVGLPSVIGGTGHPGPSIGHLTGTGFTGSGCNRFMFRLHWSVDW